MRSLPEKMSADSLGLFTGVPRFSETLHVGRPNIGNRDAFNRRINDILDRKWLTNNGPVVQEFETQIKHYLGVRHCIAVCNATIGLELTIRALGLRGEVIVPSFTFVATAHALQWLGVTPVFCDVDPQTHCIDPKRVEALITPRTTGIIGVHVWGRTASIEGLVRVAARHDLKLIFDAAHAFGCAHRGMMVGNFGRAEVFSFHATKFLNSFEGGAVATNDDVLASKLRLMVNFGFSGLDRVEELGTNGKMSEISAAMGLTSLDSIRLFIQRNRDNYDVYSSGLRDLPGVTLVNYDVTDRQNFQYVVCEIDHLVCGLTRDELVEVLRCENVVSRRYFFPGVHRMEPYASMFPDSWMNLPNTEALTKKVLLLPNGMALTPDDVLAVCQIIRIAVGNSDRVSLQLKHLNTPAS